MILKGALNTATPLMRAPPFPPRVPAISRVLSDLTLEPASNDINLASVRQMVAKRVGGSFWEPSPRIQPVAGGFSLIVPCDDAAEARNLWRRVLSSEPAATVLMVLPHRAGGFCGLATDIVKAGGMVAEIVDPHVLLDHARKIHFSAQMTDLGLLGLFAGLPVWRHPPDRGDPAFLSGADAVIAAAWVVRGTAYTDPFTNLPTGADETIALLADWRRMIMRNREVAVCAGMSRWKRRRMSQFFSTGSRSPPFLGRNADIRHRVRDERRAVAVWSTRIPRDLAAKVVKVGGALHQVEDGFIRSLGLGSGLLPPASIIVDRQRLYVDPSGPSDLETMLATAEFDDALRARARNLIDRIIREGVSKYGRGGASPVLRSEPGQRLILVPGQVEDDLSIRLGGGPLRGNAELLERVRAENASAFIVYRPHPDVEAGHRPGIIPDPVAAGLADQLSRDGPVAPLLGVVDEVHTLTSLAGFEGLLRGRRVVTYGQPFYAGWGLTDDHAPVARRKRRLTVEELAAATLILYPRYVDPRTGLLCGPETLIERFGEAALWRPSLLMRLRQLQGCLRRAGGKILGPPWSLAATLGYTLK